MIRIIATGNKLMSDDSIALTVMEKVKDIFESAGAEVIICETDPYFCLNRLEPDDYVIIADAALTGHVPGSVFSYELDDYSVCSLLSGSHHDLGILDLLLLYQNPLKGCLICIEVSEVSYGQELSKNLAEKLDIICAEVEHIVMERITKKTFQE